MPTRTEEAASTTMGAVKAAKATALSLHGVFKTLAEEHRQILVLIQQVKASTDSGVRRRLFPEIRAQLLAHEKAEMREIFPVLRNHVELAQIAIEHDHEADQMERLLGQLNVIDCDDATWGPMFQRLAEMVGRHAREEENESFPAAERVLNSDEIDRLESRYGMAKANLASRVH